MVEQPRALDQLKHQIDRGGGSTERGACGHRDTGGSRLNRCDPSGSRGRNGALRGTRIEKNIDDQKNRVLYFPQLSVERGRPVLPPSRELQVRKVERSISSEAHVESPARDRQRTTRGRRANEVAHAVMGMGPDPRFGLVGQHRRSRRVRLWLQRKRERRRRPPRRRLARSKLAFVALLR